jgi:hypothetical protein
VYKEESVEETIPSQGVGSGPIVPTVHTSSRARRGAKVQQSNGQATTSTTVASRGTSIPTLDYARVTGLELAVNPAGKINNSLSRSKELEFSHSVKDSYDLAKRDAMASGEVLVWGRIFAESVVCNMEFTLDVSNLHLRFARELMVDPEGLLRILIAVLLAVCNLDLTV